MRIQDDLNTAIDSMLDGTRPGLKEYGCALFLMNCLLRDLHPMDLHLKKYPIFEQVLDQRQRYAKAGDAEAIDDLKQAARKAVERGRDRINAMIERILPAC